MKIVIPFLCLYSVFVVGQRNSDVYFELAEKFKSNSKIDSALFYFNKAAIEYKSQENAQRYVDSYNQIGIMLTRQDEYDKAKVYLNEALTFGSVTLDAMNLSMATTYISLGVLYNAEGFFDESIAFHNRALTIRLSKLGRLHADVATSYGNIGNVHFNNKDYQKALEAHQNALSIRKELFGENGVELIQSYINLGNTYREKREYESAIKYFELALKNSIIQRGPTHKEVSKIHKNISDVYFLMNDLIKGNYYKEKAALN